MLRPTSGLPVAALLAVVAGSLAACDDGSPAPAPAPPSPTSTPLQEFSTRELSVAREDFCAQVAPAAVERALGGKATGSTTYGNGDRVMLAPGVKDVAHEYGCRWRGRGGTTAAAWVFAPPVTKRWAAELRAAAPRAAGCAAVPDAPRFGSRSVAVRCRDDGATSITFQGLFGDAWLSCSLQAGDQPAEPADDLLDRTGRWCVTVAQAASA